MKLYAHVSDDIKRHWKIVRTDALTDVQGDIVEADEDTGECSVRVLKTDGTGESEVKTLGLGRGGIKIVQRARR